MGGSTYAGGRRGKERAASLRAEQRLAAGGRRLPRPGRVYRTKLKLVLLVVFGLAPSNGRQHVRGGSPREGARSELASGAATGGGGPQAPPTRTRLSHGPQISAPRRIRPGTVKWAAARTRGVAAGRSA